MAYRAGGAGIRADDAEVGLGSCGSEGGGVGSYSSINSVVRRSLCQTKTRELILTAEVVAFAADV